jgi:DNA-binding CsgD family transcriptional regulator
MMSAKTILVTQPTDLKKTMLYDTTADMRHIMSDLHRLDVTFFSLTRIHRDASVEEFTTHPEYDELFIELGLHERAFNGNVDDYISGFLMMDDLGCPELVDMFYQVTHTKNGCILTKKFQDYVETYYFAQCQNSRKVDLSYDVNIIVKLEQYINTFRDKTYALMKKSRKHNRMTYDVSCHETTQLKMLDHNGRDNLALLSIETLHQHLIQDKLSELSLRLEFSKQEYLCAKHLLTGLTVQEIADAKTCSKRTIEMHLNAVRHKTNVSSLLEFATKLMTL